MTPTPTPTYLETKADRDSFLHEKTTSEGGASIAGHHFIQEYNANKWSFYLRYIRGLEPNHKKPALLFGGAVHDAKEAFYLTRGNIDFALEAFDSVMRSRRPLYESQEQHTKDSSDGKKMLFHWASTYGANDLETYDIVEVEGSHEFRLANGFLASVRWDLLVRRKDTRKYYLFDTKTTRYSVAKSYDSVEGQDQVTMYLLGLSRVYPDIFENCGGLIPDIMYKRQSVISSERPGLVIRTKREILEYEQELIGLHLELAQKVKALRDGHPLPHMLFPRNGKDDSFFGSDWPDIYRAALPEDPTKAPIGYRVNLDIVESGPAAALASLNVAESNYPSKGATE